MTEKYSFLRPNNVLFFTGTALSGKTTLAPILAHNINNCVMQHMDIVRLMSQDVQMQKPEPERDNYVFYGSTDAYKLVGDGTFSESSLVQGYRLYATAVTRLLFSMFDKLNPEDIDNIIFEGVQLMPELVAPYLKRDEYGLVILTAGEAQFEHNRNEVFTDERVKAKYTNDKLLSIQNEILRQAAGLPPEKVCIIENQGNPEDTMANVFKFLVERRFIRENIQE